MFKNNVFKASVSTKQWLVATATRTVRSVAFTALSLITASGTTMGSVNWELVLSSVGMTAIVTVLTCIAGVPEVKESKEEKE